MSGLVTTITVATALACGLVGGVFFAFSNFVMPALARRPDLEALAAMQAINVTAVNPAFMLALFGPVPASVGLGAWGFGSLDQGGLWVLAGGLVYVLGCAGVTVVFNVPLNDEIERAEADDAATWQHYLARWTAWNTVRTVAALAAAVLLTVGALEA